MNEIKCDRCQKTFKYTYLLDRHNNNKNICQSISETNEGMIKTNDYIMKETKYKCDYCFKSYTRKDNLTRHMKDRCKLKNDNVIIYERELNIKLSDDNNTLCCRFCNKTFSTTSNHIRHITIGCKSKAIYEKKLEQLVLEKRNSATNHTTQIINNNYGNININLPQMKAFGEENLDYITTKFLLQELVK